MDAKPNAGDVEILCYDDMYKEQVIELIIEIQQKEYGFSTTAADLPDLQNVAEYYKNGKFWIAVYEGKVVGTIGCMFLRNNNVFLRKLFTNINYRGKDFQTGQKLLNTLESFCIDNNKKDIYLGTRDEYIAAQRFYEKNNYVEVTTKELPDDFEIRKVYSKFYYKTLL